MRHKSVNNRQIFIQTELILQKGSHLVIQKNTTEKNKKKRAREREKLVMFTNLTSYFWGGGSAATPAAEEMGAPSTEQAGRKLAETGGAAAKVAGLEEVVQDAQDPTLMTSTEEEDWLMVDSHLTAGECGEECV